MPEGRFSTLSENIRGNVITPAAGDYELARKVYNGMIDRHPGIIVRCANVADVRTAVNFARQERLTVAIRGGGHNGIHRVCGRIDSTRCRGGVEANKAPVIDVLKLRRRARTNRSKMNLGGPLVSACASCIGARNQAHAGLSQLIRASRLTRDLS